MAAVSSFHSRTILLPLLRPLAFLLLPYKILYCSSCEVSLLHLLPLTPLRAACSPLAFPWLYAVRCYTGTSWSYMRTWHSFRCFADLHRVALDQPGVSQRIFCVQASADSSSQYIPVMNCIFSAQKQVRGDVPSVAELLSILTRGTASSLCFITSPAQNTPIDAVVIAAADSTFLQQAAHITGGVYLKPAHRTSLVQYLLVRATV